MNPVLRVKQIVFVYGMTNFTQFPMLDEELTTSTTAGHKHSLRQGHVIGYVIG